ncbi:hypothetical protein Ciccas_002882 [Cichlidogyrus casuarinus]|uniref:Fibrillar collagen NC1 domain-containing protein n=1 Tax=Cichlidogyrus casuarinus TaxID=1844966 RepID=A0ABD2QFY3_9PLAT
MLNAVEEMVNEIYYAKGTLYSPSRSCHDLKMSLELENKTTTDGMYYIDPNGGHWRDAIQISCALSKEADTCFNVDPELELKGHKISRSGDTWLSEQLRLPTDQIEYKIPKDQLALLQISMDVAKQNLTILCRDLSKEIKSNLFEIITLIGDDDEDMQIKEQNETYSIRIINDTCSQTSASHGMLMIEIVSEIPSKLPVRNVLLKAQVASREASFDYEMGKVCFGKDPVQNLTELLITTTTTTTTTTSTTTTQEPEISSPTSTTDSPEKSDFTEAATSTNGPEEVESSTDGPKTSGETVEKSASIFSRFGFFM